MNSSSVFPAASGAFNMAEAMPAVTAGSDAKKLSRVHSSLPLVERCVVEAAGVADERFLACALWPGSVLGPHEPVAGEAPAAGALLGTSSTLSAVGAELAVAARNMCSPTNLSCSRTPIACVLVASALTASVNACSSSFSATCETGGTIGELRVADSGAGACGCTRAVGMDCVGGVLHEKGRVR